MIVLNVAPCRFNPSRFGNCHRIHPYKRKDTDMENDKTTGSIPISKLLLIAVLGIIAGTGVSFVAEQVLPPIAFMTAWVNSVSDSTLYDVSLAEKILLRACEGIAIIGTSCLVLLGARNLFGNNTGQ